MKTTQQPSRNQRRDQVGGTPGSLGLGGAALGSTPSLSASDGGARADEEALAAGGRGEGAPSPEDVGGGTRKPEVASWESAAGPPAGPAEAGSQGGAPKRWVGEGRAELQGKAGEGCTGCGQGVVEILGVKTPLRRGGEDLTLLALLVPLLLRCGGGWGKWQRLGKWAQWVLYAVCECMGGSAETSLDFLVGMQKVYKLKLLFYKGFWTGKERW
ncbi:hypothetical protein B0H10DRAFT_1950242 [Mycena sp. CBHHK59/15]|nr:hypothetical protein B0H10DRAFT_1950242 [Mycena sp. CBHHK59/15]